MAVVDESESDDGALHREFATVPLERIRDIIRFLYILARVRGTPTPEQKARAQELADDPIFPLADHPVIRRILEAA